jgi:RNA:NAD 2'-phosphotransferase (TPT1/KptA family)
MSPCFQTQFETMQLETAKSHMGSQEVLMQIGDKNCQKIYLHVQSSLALQNIIEKNIKNLNQHYLHIYTKLGQLISVLNQHYELFLLAANNVHFLETFRLVASKMIRASSRSKCIN